MAEACEYSNELYGTQTLATILSITFAVYLILDSVVVFFVLQRKAHRVECEMNKR